MDTLGRGTDEVALQRYGDSGPQALVLPAMGVDGDYYTPFARALVEEGLQCAVMDWRGHGHSTPPVSRASRYGYQELAADVGAAVEHLGGDVLLIGHSLGGQVALLAGATGACRADRIVLVAAGVPTFADYRGLRRLVLLPYTQAIGATARLLGVWPGWTFGGRQSGPVMRDWAHIARTGRFPMFGATDPNVALSTLRARVLAVHIEGDTMTPQATMGRLLRMTPNATVTGMHYTAADAGGYVDHIKWVRNSRTLAHRIAEYWREVPDARTT
jgi:predicted alpha/beta hydrolase